MTTTANSAPSPGRRWFSFPKPNPAAKVRLFCFPYAGTGANIYYKWTESLPADVELCLVHLPGRDNRLSESPFDRMSLLLQALGRCVLPYLDLPVALFGHSMGALISFALSRHLRALYGLEPAHLFVSGCAAPSAMRSAFNGLDVLSDRLVEATLRLGRAESLCLENGGLVAMMTPTLKADISLCESYAYEQESPLDCAVSVYGGREDQQVKLKALEAWRQETTGPFSLSEFAGGHFFVQSDQERVLKTLNAELQHLADELN